MPTGNSAGAIKILDIVSHQIKNVPPNIEKAVKKLSEEIEKEFPGIANSRWIAFRLLEGDTQIIEALKTGELV